MSTDDAIGEWQLTHPGEHLHEGFLAPLGLSAATLADQLDIPIDAVNSLVDEQVPLDLGIIFLIR